MRKKFLVKQKYLLILKSKKMKNLQEMSLNEMRETEGGILPIAVIYGCWGVMAVCSAVALGMREALKEKQ